MNILETIKKNSYKYVNEKFNSLKNTFIEMSVIKSEFDIEKLTIKKQGNFIAHNYHFLIRQYSLGMSELRRMKLDREEHVRDIEELKEQEKEGNKKTKDGKYIDIEIKRLENQVDMLEINIASKAYSCDYMEKCRLKLIEMNGGTEPTNDQYQAEEPDYIKWFLEREVYYDSIQRQSGIRVGVLSNIDLLEEKPVLNENYKRILDKKMDINKYLSEAEKNKNIDKRILDSGIKKKEIE